MALQIDLVPLIEYLNQPGDQLMADLFFNFGWIPIALVFLEGAKMLWLDYVQGQYASKQTFLLLAIDVPRNNAQDPQAVENIFAYLAGAESTPDLIKKWWVGEFQLGFSFEVVSIDGYTQFLIRTPKQFRNMVESAVYAQYPDAEISEVDDYTAAVPSKYPDSEWDIWGTELVYTKPWPYPLRSYKEFFVEKGKPEEQFKDPMAALMDLYSSLRTGEQIWFQIAVKPVPFDYAKEGQSEVATLMKEAAPAAASDGGLVGMLFKGVNTIFELMFKALNIEAIVSAPEKKTEALTMQNLKPSQKKQLENIQRKLSQVCMRGKMRFIYAARKELMNKPKAINGFMGYVKQFTDLDLNGLKPGAQTKTSASYFFAQLRMDDRKRAIMGNYKSRSNWAGETPSNFSAEEMASLWHFPFEAVVKAPLIQKAAGRRAEPPLSLPYGVVRESKLAPGFLEGLSPGTESDANDALESVFVDSPSGENIFQDPPVKEARPKDEAPDNLPFA